MGKAALGKHWYNNGIKELYAYEQPEGFIKGRLPISSETRYKMSINNFSKKLTPEQSKEIHLKISNTYNNKSLEEKLKYRQKLSECRKGKGKGHIPWNKGKKGVQQAWNKGKHIQLSEQSLKNMIYKQYITKKKNNSFHTSKIEDNYYSELLQRYDNNDILRQYQSVYYPYRCDFYIKSEDLYIELNLHWTHGGRPYDPNDKKCQEQLKLWQEKAKTSQYFKNAIMTWTIRDVQKLKIAKQNKINYKVIYNIREV